MKFLKCQYIIENKIKYLLERKSLISEKLQGYGMTTQELKSNLDQNDPFIKR